MRTECATCACVCGGERRRRGSRGLLERWAADCDMSCSNARSPRLDRVAPLCCLERALGTQASKQLCGGLLDSFSPRECMGVCMRSARQRGLGFCMRRVIAHESSKQPAKPTSCHVSKRAAKTSAVGPFAFVCAIAKKSTMIRIWRANKGFSSRCCRAFCFDDAKYCSTKRRLDRIKSSD